MNTSLIISLFILVLIISILIISQYAKKSKIRSVCQQIVKCLLLGVLPLSEKDRDSLIMS